MVDASGMAEAPGPGTRLTIYTALVGAKEALNDPLRHLPADAATDLELDFVCVTDSRDLRSDVWRFHLLPHAHLPAEKLSRRPKAMPHEYFPESRYSLYIDNTVTFRRLPHSSDLATDQPYLLRAFRHPSRASMPEEADAVALLGYDDIETICRQLDFYGAATPLNDIAPLTAATVLLRSHHSEPVRRFGTLWWESLLAFSKRDQLSIDFALQQSSARFDHLPGSTTDNDLLHWGGALPGGKRVRASFDALRYAWRHRHDALARQDPRAHFLAHGEGEAAHCDRRPRLLEYICHRQGSSLGQQVSPRRGMADALDALLGPLRSGGGRFLVVRVHGGKEPGAFEDGELDAAMRALSMYLGRQCAGTVLDLSPDDLDLSKGVYAAPPQPFDLVLLLGAGGDRIEAATQRLMRLLSSAGASFVAALSSPASLTQALAVERLLAGHLGAELRTAMHGSTHDDFDTPLDNTLLGFSGGGRAPGR